MKLRSADSTTIIRVGLIVLVAYLIIVKFDVLITVLLLGLSIFLDSVDGFLALREASRGKIGLSEYLRYVSGKNSKKVLTIKRSISKKYPWGPRMDIAGDRITEYVMWIVFTFLHVLPIFILFIIVIRHSFADAFMAAKGTSSKTLSNFSRIFYTSNWSRAVINILKFITFVYLILVYVMNYPMYIGYLLVAVLVGFILLRGSAEIYEVFRSYKMGTAIRKA